MAPASPIPESGGVAFNGLPTVEQLGEFKVINNTFSGRVWTDRRWH